MPFSSKRTCAVLFASTLCSLAVPSAKADVPFSEWAKNHSEWVNCHRDRYNFFMQHPDEAQRSRSEWSGMNPGRHLGQMRFSEWCEANREWVNGHHDRCNYFMQHPEQAERCRSEWQNWHQPIASNLHQHGAGWQSGMQWAHSHLPIPANSMGKHLGELAHAMPHQGGAPQAPHAMHFSDFAKNFHSASADPGHGPSTGSLASMFHAARAEAPARGAGPHMAIPNMGSHASAALEALRRR